MGADLDQRARAARAQLALAQVFAYNPLQPRGPDGRWIKSGGGVGAPSVPRAPSRKAAPRKAAARSAGASGWLKEAASGKLSAPTKKQVEQLFAYSDSETGMKSKVTNVTTAPGGRVQVTIDVNDKDGNWVGRAMRNIEPPKGDSGKTRVYHTSFQLAPRAQGGGFSSRWLRQMEDRYREQGIGEIALTTQDVGGYAWAKAGFDFADRKEARVAAGILSRKLNAKSVTNRMSQREITDARELIRRAKEVREEPPTPMEFAMLGWRPGLDSWVGKETMVGSGWHGVKEL